MTSDNGLTRTDGLVFDDAQRQIIRDSFANGASDQEFALLMEVARSRRLNPLMRQIHFVKRWDSGKGREVWSVQVSIDGLRAVAERTGLYAGQDEPEFVEEPDGTLKLCKVRVYRKDWPRPAVGVAHWSEYVQTIRDRATGKERPAAMWARMPHVMLAKCAESLALRKAFPEDASGLYTTEEMGQAERDLPDLEVYTEQPPRQALPAAHPQLVSTTVAPAAQREPGEDDDAPAPAAAQHSDVVPLAAFEAALAHVNLPTDAVVVWLSHRAALAPLDASLREGAWKALCDRTETVGKMKNAKAWLKKAISEEDARRAAPAADPTRPDDDPTPGGPQGPRGGRRPTASAEGTSAPGPVPAAAPQARWEPITTSKGARLESALAAEAHLASLGEHGIRNSFARHHGRRAYAELCVAAYARVRRVDRDTARYLLTQSLPDRSARRAA
jgi:phage recombination protein Bet